jgi:hypothetical protein
LACQLANRDGNKKWRSRPADTWDGEFKKTVACKAITVAPASISNDRVLLLTSPQLVAIDILQFLTSTQLVAIDSSP